MRFTQRVLAVFVAATIAVPAFAAEPAVTRADGFLLIWQSIQRPVETTREKPFTDVALADVAGEQITFAKARGIVSDDDTQFHPHDSMTLRAALLWIFRTRNVEQLKADGTVTFMELPEVEDIPLLAAKYDVSYENPDSVLTREELLDLMRKIDGGLRTEVHETSLYSEKFHGKGTAFGESFNMNALTAAHRSYPHNTLVRVTNTANGKTVTVRINDRGPFVQGRDMDLSLAAFTTISERSAGKINATFERLGDASMVRSCGDERAQTVITKGTVLTSGVPHGLALGASLRLSSSSYFVVRSVTYPDGNRSDVQDWISPGEEYVFKPSIAGAYEFRLGAVNGRVHRFLTEVVDCGSGETPQTPRE